MQISLLLGAFYSFIVPTEIVRGSKQIYLSLFSLTATCTTFLLSVTVSSVLSQTNVIIRRQKSQTLIQNTAKS